MQDPDQTIYDPQDDPRQPQGSGPEVSTLSPGTLLAGRYEVVKTLGVGGMGAVYSAFDRQLTRIVALKTILPEMGASPQALKRFKQEVLLAQKIVHKNVVRIFDMGEDSGTKFITMEFIEGEDLKDLIQRRGKLPPEEAVGIIRQVCRGLEAAHAEGVVHRDLKPQNVMMDQNGHAMVMDFGIAQSGASGGLTQTGAFVGTPDYMSPEQALREELDVRSDIFSLGLIFYELLTGKLPFQANTILESMFKRTKERAISPAEIEKTVPRGANDIVVKCLEIERDRRYQSITELLNDLETFDPSKKVSAAFHAKARLRKVSQYRNWAIAGIAVVVALAVGSLFRSGLFVKTEQKQTPLTVLVSDFSNTTGDPVFSGTLESMSITALEEAPFVNNYRPGDARKLLENGATALDEASARRIAIREGINVVIAGSIAREGKGFEVSVRAIDPFTSKVLVTNKVNAANSDVVLPLVGKLIAPVRRALGDTTPESVQLAAAETYTAGTLEAAHAYAQGQESQIAGKSAEAIQYYKQAISLDQNLGRAYSGLASVYVNQKKQAEAEEPYKKALSLVDRMSEREKQRTLGTYYLSFAGNYPQAIETLRKLVLLYPGDGAAFNNLGTAYKRVGNMAEAAAASRRAIEISPNNKLRRYNHASNSMFAGDLTTAATEAERILQNDPKFVYAYTVRALVAVLQGDLDKATQVYGQLEKVDSQGASLSKMGQADLKMYIGRNQEAAEILRAGIAEDQKEGNSGEQAQKLLALAETQLASGKSKDAGATAIKAAEASKLDGVQFLAARTLVEADEEAKAQLIVEELEKRLQNLTKSLASMIKGDIAMKRKQLSAAVDAYREAQKLQDSWISHVLLGRAYVEAGLFPEALTELETAEKKASEASDLFDYNTTSLHYLPPLYYWLGRAKEGIGTADAARKSYQRYIAIREKADADDPLLADAKRRAGQ